MSSLLKRLSVSLDRPSLGGPREQGPTLASHPSFNDFSFHVNSDVHEVESQSGTTASATVRESIDTRVSFEEPRPVRTSPFMVGSAPAGLAPIFPRTAALKIPKASVAHSLKPAQQPDATPRSVVDTPRRSEDMPASPRSPTSPTGRRRGAATPRSPRSGKIDGLDYYDYCELLRSTSL